MRLAPVVAVLLSALLSACASVPEVPTSRHEFQAGPLKINPGLYGKNAKVEIAPSTTPAPRSTPVPAVAAVVAPLPAAAPVVAESVLAPVDEPALLATSKDLTAHLRSERSFYFDLNQSELKTDYDPVLKAHASYLAQHPEARVRIEGHADERGGHEHNRRLGKQRAETVRSELIDRGAPDRQIGIKSYGEAKPKLKGHDEESWAENRRADVVYESE